VAGWRWACVCGGGGNKSKKGRVATKGIFRSDTCKRLEVARFNHALARH
jgi:hypothetical protein